MTKRLSAFLIVCAMAVSGCGGDSTTETLGLGPDLNSTAPRTVADSDFTTSPTGLKFHDFVAGTGDEASFGLIATVHYTGWLTNGSKFDSSLDRNDPFAFRVGVGGVIRGWDEGVAGMRVGGKRQLVIPPALAYGASGTGSIPPNSTLVFEIELLRVE
jgi:FKBP-type peptidyl-prolyl cis-trans isomerase